MRFSDASLASHAHALCSTFSAADWAAAVYVAEPASRPCGPSGANRTKSSVKAGSCSSASRGTLVASATSVATFAER